jgi:ADP-ribosylglycohydrolase
LSGGNEKTHMNVNAVIGCLLGTAIGDALGLPYEGLSPQRAARVFPHRDRYHLVFGRGMVSDDTEHTCMVAQSLIEARGDVSLFVRRFARRLRWWMLGLPAGVGFATLRALLKLWIGISPEKSGVFSAGNGPAMRSALFGILFGNNFTKMQEFVRASTLITHTDPKAYWGALAVAVAASVSCSTQDIDGERYYEQLADALSSEEASEFLDLIRAAVTSCRQQQNTRDFAASLRLEYGVSGYVYHTVPVVIHAWLSSPNDFQKGLLSMIACGGDTDTTGAILGGIIGCRVGKQGIPDEWLEHLWE